MSHDLGIPTGLPPLLDMNDEENEAVKRAVERLNRRKKRQGG